MNSKNRSTAVQTKTAMLPANDTGPAQSIPSMQDLAAGIDQNSYERSVKLVPSMNDQRLPPLPRVPNIAQQPLTMRISNTGVTMLRSGSFKKRFTGGEAVVDINGQLHLSRRAYKEFLNQENADRENWKIAMGISKKNGRRISHEGAPNSSKDVGNEGKNILPPAKEKKQYTVNKTEVTNRIASMTNALFHHQKTGSFLGMLTVTFPPCVTEAIAMQALNTWLTALRQKGKRMIREYLWISERQDGKRLADPGKATNTIHYHILILNRMNIVNVNRAMRVVLCNMVRAGAINYPLSAMKRYNGVDLAKDRKTRQVTNFCDPKARKALSYYITKYVTKNNGGFNHAAWGCSRGFSAIFTAITCTMQEFIRMGWDALAWQDPAISNDWFEFFPWQKDCGPPADFTQYLSSVNIYILRQRGFLN